MRTGTRSSKRIAIAIVVALLAAVGIIGGLSHARAGSPKKQDNRILFGLVGVTLGQSVQLNVSNILPPVDPEMPVSVELMIFDADGVLLAHSMERLAAGHSASLTLNRDLLLGRREVRLGLRALVNVDPPEPSQPPDPGIVGSFEVLDNASQRTLFVMPPWVK